MVPRFQRTGFQRTWPVVALLLLGAAGCGDEERNVGANNSRAKTSGAGGSPKVAAPAEPEFIVGKRTTDIRNAAPELKSGGAELGTTKITAKDYITLQGNAYVTTIGRTSILSIEHAMKLYQAEHDRYPKNYEEFMSDIIKANNLALPLLPHYQKYGYDEKEHKLVILEYPALKNPSPVP